MAKKKIVIMDDEEFFCFFVKKNLEYSGEFSVITTSRAKEGIDLIKKEKPDAILLDMVMPGISGGDIASQLAADPKSASIPILFLTAMHPQEEMVKEDNDFQDNFPFVTKPVETEKLISAIKELLAAKASGALGV